MLIFWWFEDWAESVCSPNRIWQKTSALGLSLRLLYGSLIWIGEAEEASFQLQIRIRLSFINGKLMENDIQALVPYTI